MEKKKKTQDRQQTLFITLGVVAALIGLFGIIQLSSTSTAVDQMITEQKEALRPAELSLVVITDSRCDSCNNAEQVKTTVTDKNVKILKEETLDMASERAKELIGKYDITKIPSVLVFGETDKVSFRDFVKDNDALVYQKSLPPFSDTASDTIKGIVQATIIKDSSCAACIDLDQLLAQFKESGIVLGTTKELEWTGPEAQEFIRKYAITSIPSLVLSADMGVYGTATETQWKQMGTVEKDGSHVLRSTTPPYVDTATGKMIGEVTLIVLEDKSCQGCFEAQKFNMPILKRLGLEPATIRNIDASSEEGKALISRYSIKKMPTILLEGDPEVYTVLTKAWKEVGTVEEDGTYVFRKVEIGKQPYRDLATDTIIDPNDKGRGDSSQTQASAQTASTGSAGGVKEITMTARNWKFEPNIIRVKKGDRVKLSITSVDVTHGFNLPAFGINENLEPGKTVTVEFVADKTGTFPFACSVYCGQGHSSMTGELVVS
ncbi:MAG: hypothetical protein GXP63_06745 [DPANN group archaeon]|nr:hypothetical protein [DPANN group archaeon]